MKRLVFGFLFIVVGVAVQLLATNPTLADPGDDTCDSVIAVTLPHAEVMNISFPGDHNWRSFDVAGPIGAIVKIRTLSDTPGTTDDDTDLTLWQGCQGGTPLSQLGFNDDDSTTGAPLTSQIQTVCLGAGTYLVEIGGSADVATPDNFTLQIDQLGLCLAPSPNLLTRSIASLSGQSDPILIDLGAGPVSTGPISYQLQVPSANSMTIDSQNDLAEIDIHLEMTFPLLDAIGSPPLTMRVREVGPVTWGVHPGTNELAGWANLSGGGVIDPGTPFENGIFFNRNGWEIMIGESHAGTVGSAAPVPYPDPFDPYPPPELLEALPLTSPYVPASVAQVESMFPMRNDDSTFGFIGIFRFPGQAGDIDVLGDGDWRFEDFVGSDEQPVAAIPTISEWGILITALLLLSLGSTAIRLMRPALAANVGHSSTIDDADRVVFIPRLFAKTLTLTMIPAVAGLLTYGWVTRGSSTLDVTGTLICALIVAFLAHQWVPRGSSR